MNTQRTIQFLMANLGSEVARLFSFKRKGEFDQARSSSERASKIIDSLEKHPDIHGGRGEVEIMKEIINDAMSVKPKLHVTENELKSYFMPFSLRALAENGIV